MRAGCQQGAGVLARAFFPGAAFRELELAQEEFNKAWRELPAELRAEIKSGKPDPADWPAAVVPRLRWVEAPSIPKDRIADCLPLAQDRLEMLDRIVPEIKPSLKLLQAP